MLARRNNNEHWGTISICTGRQEYFLVIVTYLQVGWSILLASVAGRDVFQMPAQQQAVDVSCHLTVAY